MALQTGNFIYVKDIVQANILASKTGTQNLCCGFRV